MKKILFLFLIMLLVGSAVYAEENSNKPAPLAKPMVNSDIWIDANRMNGVYRNNGTWLYDNVAGNWGLEWPKGSGLSPIFAGGQWVGAVVDGDIRVAGIQHSATEFQPGMILEPFEADNPRDGKYVWYSIEPGGQGDWSNWPFDQGAPFVDDNGNGVYDPGEAPELVGDITAYSVWNDMAAHTEYSTNKLSVEVGQTVFAFNRADALGDMQFIKWRLVNKSGEAWDSTYFSIWLDPDVGGATDDLVGCDPDLGLGYCYNGAATDQSYGSTPPATGLDFFQGPLFDSPGSTVTLPNGTVLADKEMLKMTSFVFYNNNDDPVNGNPQSGKDVWNFMRSIWRNDQPITQGGRGIDPNAPRAYFMFDGDPETATGWLDDEADDRRFLMTTGPFSMDAWDDSGLDGEPGTGDAGEGNGLAELGEPGVQDIVASVMVARSTDNLKSVTKLKEVDELAQLAYDLNFKLAKAPIPPAVTTSAIANEVILSWDETSEFNSIDDGGGAYESADPIVGKAYGDTVIMDNVVKEINDSTYNFYGYTVYQYSDASGADPVQLAHWDNGGTLDAEDYTHPRFLRVLENKNPAVGVVGEPLINGKEYYFGVVAEGYLEFGAPDVLESAPTIVPLTPAFTAGERFSAQFNDTLNVTHTGTSDGSVTVWVVDPSKVTGKNYEVTFNADMTWNLTADGDTVVKNQTNQTGNDAYNVLDGLMIKVAGPDPGINLNIDGPYGYYPGAMGYNTLGGGTRWVSWPINWGLETMFGSLGNGYSFFGSDVAPSDYVDVELRFAGCTDRSDTTSEGLMAASKLEYPERWQKAIVYHRPTYAPQATLGDVPMTVWDVENNRQLKVAFVEEPRNGADGLPLGNANLIWDMGWNSSDFADYGGREYFFIINDTYDEDYTEYLNGNLDGTYNGVMYASGWGSRGYPYLYDAFQIQIYASNVNSPTDVFTFTAPAAGATTATTLKADLDKVKVVPNPYYGYHSGEINPFDRWVQFTYIPPNKEVTIRIFDLAGNVVWKETKNDDQTLVRWNMHNEYDLPVASGVYVYQVEVKGVGEKIGKLAIFSPTERLDTY